MNDKVSWLGQNGFLMDLQRVRICLDPYLSFSKKFTRIPPLPMRVSDLRSDVFIFTHDHGDHLNEETVWGSFHPKAQYYGPLSCVEHLLRMNIPSAQVHVFNTGDSICYGDVRIRAVFAAHTGDSIGVVFQTPEYTIYNTGDSLFDERLLASCTPDLLFVCINGQLGNMTYTQATELAQRLKAKQVIPTHYGMFYENDFCPDVFTRLAALRGIPYSVLDYNREYDITDLLK